MEIEERIDRLEKQYEKLHHESELLSIYIPKLTDILIKYWGASGRYRGVLLSDMKSLRSVIELVDKDLQEHFKEHSKPIRKKEYKQFKGIHP